MAVIGTFGSFTAARLGIYASQASLNVTGNNIANINTTGYTRQRVDLASIYAGGVDRYQSKYSVNIGYGVLTEGVSQLRDPYIDIRYRTEESYLGQYEFKLKGLDILAGKLDEVGDGKGEFGMIERQFNDLIQQLQNLSEKTGSQEYDTLVRGSSETLTDLFRVYGKALADAKKNTEDEFETNLKEVNTILINIRNLNESIRKANICGDKALELRDERNVQIDKLSKLMRINVTYDMERIDQYTEVERLNIHLANDKGEDVTELVRGIFVGQVSMPDQVPELNENYDPENPDTGRYIDANGHGTNDITQARLQDNTTYQLQVDTLKNRWDKVFTDEKTGKTSTDVRLADDDLIGGLQALREMLTEEGEFASEADLAADPKADVKRGIPYYQQSLDLLARKFAQIMNEANQLPMGDLAAAYKTKEDPAGNGNKLFVDSNNNPFTFDVTLKDGTQIKIAGVDAHGHWIDETGTALDENGKPLDENDEKSIPLDLSKLDYDQKQEILNTMKENGELTPEYSWYKGGPLFTIGDKDDTTTGFLASNITVSHAWANREVQVMNTLRPDRIVEATKAEYESGTVNWTVDTAKTQDLTIGGYTVTAAAGEDRATVLNAFVGLYNANSPDKDNWEASLNAAGDGIVFTAKTAGDLKTTGVEPPAGTTVKSVGMDEYKITHTTANDNIDHIIGLFTTKFPYNSTEINGDAVPSDYFTGTFQEFFTNMSHTLATDQETTIINLSNHEIQALKEENNRQSVSGVDLNDEATNMMQFQKSYQAACRLLTTLDSMLDTLINNTIR